MFKIEEIEVFKVLEWFMNMPLIIMNILLIYIFEFYKN